jgi:hypothetical protein
MNKSSLILVLILILVLVLVLGATAQTTVTFPLQSLGTTNNNATILVTPDVPPQVPFNFGPALAIYQPRTLTPTNGLATAALIPWGYTIRVAGWPRSAHIVVPTITSGSPPINVVTLINTNQFSPLQILYQAQYANGNSPISSNNLNYADGTTLADTTDTLYGNGSALNFSGSGYESLVIGTVATATGRDCVAFGNNSAAANDYTAALGYGANASGQQAIALGYDANASGGGDVALGYYASAASYASIALGMSTTAPGYQSIAIGSQADCPVDNAVEIGPGTANVSGWLHYNGYPVISPTGTIPSTSISGGISFTQPVWTNSAFTHGFYLLVTNGIIGGKVNF